MRIRGIVWIAVTAMVALLAPAARAEIDTDKIDAAANRAVAYLKASQAGQGYWVHRGNSNGEHENNIGATALVGLALLESDVKRDDPILAAAARNVRNAAPTLKTTYAIALAVLFLDRYGDGKEQAIVRTMALRLAAGQNQSDGGWDYNCPVLTGAQEQFWMGELRRFQKVKDFGTFQQAGRSDNSNTQFAVLALWIARNHGIPVEYPLFKAEWRFRQTQEETGGWNYSAGINGIKLPSTPSMTCAGLLGLAVAYGAKREQQAKLTAQGSDKIEGAPSKPTGTPRLDIATDPAVLRAKEYLAFAVKQPPRNIQHFLYFLWSLERASVTYRFKEYGGIDWYEYGSSLLLSSQQQNGSWDIEDGPTVDTCFALLFLRKANLVGDISGTARLTAEKNTGDPLKNAANSNTAAKPKATDPSIKELPKDKNAADEAKKLVAEFAMAKSARQDEILGILQDTKDSTGNFTQALIDLIPTVKDNLQARVRSALAERLSRQPLDSLRTKLTDSDVEMRIGAARAMGMKTDAGGRPDTRAMPDLIKLLGNSNESLAAAAEQSLGALTERDFGRNPARWQEFYEKLPASRR